MGAGPPKPAFRETICETPVFRASQKANGHEPYEYLRYLFEKLPMARSKADLTAALLAWNLTPKLIKAFLTTLPVPD